ncbi:hypothetical protein K469DRAFT_580505 [Zopfia rhizophila CBS 207.26]|uniref:LITAF domain-containing protein n=1 Tax=Zopfia rhizophila CBS 207.26 TaxID=1314779 RepID=A0A6A6DZF7_9PEZI|nr:hypothetical protein K469DRAFT_580505 [Zopfia rhizophila CBS 207.26]
MGNPTTPQESAPAYEDVIHDHPVNQYPPSGSASAYAAVPQDDVELQAGEHNHTSPSPVPRQPETLVQTIAGVFRPKPHVHCEQCDVQMAARERRANERHCCTMVAATFMVGFVCLLLLGIVVAGSVAKTKKHGQQ